MAPENRASYLLRPKAPAFTVSHAPYPSLHTSHSLIIRTRAIAVNPVGYVFQTNGTNLQYPWLKYPAILGFDAAGEVVKVGTSVTRFRKGDRVFGLCYGLEKSEKPLSEKGYYPRSAFQEYVMLEQDFTAPIPDSMSFEQACVTPLALITAAQGLFSSEHLNLTRPGAVSAQADGTVLIWGGSTAVGMNAIQLAVAAGYEVFTTCSPRNFEALQTLGATQIWDYNSQSVVQDIITAFQGKTCVGALTLGAGAVDKAFDILDRVNGRKTIALGTFPLPEPLPQRFALPRLLWFVTTWTIGAYIKSWTRGIRWSLVMSTKAMQSGLAKELFTNFLPSAMQSTAFVPKPDAQVVGVGIEFVQEAVNRIGKGVSASKLVVKV